MDEKILIVDDDAGLAKSLKKKLEKQDGYKVTVANSGKECFELLKKGKIPDVILLDLIMPDVSGWETYNVIKEKWQDIPIIFLTGRPEETADHAVNFFGDGHIKKPFELIELKHSINTVLINTDSKKEMLKKIKI